MEIMQVSITELIPYENNPRNNESAIDKVADSIKEFGFKVPLVIDKNYVIVCGHTRYLAAQRLRITEIPCIMASDLSDEQIKAFRLVDNKTAEYSSWDYDLLNEELADLTLNMTDFGFIEAKDIDIDDFFVETVEGNYKEEESTVITEKAKSTITCPHCGKVIEL
mgnify:CR=1 FL=1